MAGLRPFSRRILNLVGGNPKESHGAWVFDAYRRTKLAAKDVECSNFSFANHKSANQYKGFFTLYHDFHGDCDGYKLGDEVTDFNEVNKELKAFAKSVHHPSGVTEKVISDCEEDSIVAYIMGYGRLQGKKPQEKPGVSFDGKTKTCDFLFNTRNSQKVLMIVDACYGDRWVELEDLPSNVAVIGAAFTSGLQLGSKDYATSRLIVGTVMQWALDRALAKFKDEGQGSWIENFEYYWHKIDWLDEEYDKTLRFTKNIEEWEDEFPKFYANVMGESPESVVGEEQGMFEFDFCDFFGVASWKDIYKPYALIHRSTEDENLVDDITEYILNKLPNFPYHRAREAACYSLYHGKRIEIP